MRKALWLILALASCATPKKQPAHRIGYFGNNTFHWATCDDLELLSWSPTNAPIIGSAGTFQQDQAKLAVRHAGKLFPNLYEPPAGDGVIVDFSKFAQEAEVTVTRVHCGLPYLKEKVQANREGLESVEKQALPVPENEVDPGDVLAYGQLYFAQDPGTNLAEAKSRFFRAGLAYPKLAAEFLANIQSQAERDHQPEWAAEAVNYRDRFEMLEELGPAKAKAD